MFPLRNKTKSSPFHPGTLARIRDCVKKHLRGTHDPESIPGLVADRAPKNIDFRIVAKTEKPPGISPKKFRCPFCNRDRQFFDGRVIVCEDNTIRLIGHNCADGHLGAEKYLKENKDYEAIIARERFERIRETVFSRLDDALAELKRERDEKVSLILSVGLLDKNIQRFHAGLWAALSAETYHNDGQLRVIRQVLDAAATFMRIDGKEIRRDRLVAITTVTGWRILANSRLPISYVNGAIKSLEQAHDIANNTKWVALGGKEFVAKLKEFSNAVAFAYGEFEGANKLIDEHFSFMNKSNLAGICAWANDSDNTKVRAARFFVVRDGLKVEDGDEDRYLRRPQKVTVVAPTIVRLKRSMEKEGENMTSI